jgi:hypothetical protein
MFTRMLIGIAIALSSLVLILGAAPAGADPNSSIEPNPFGNLTCNCQQTTPADGPALTAELDRGIQAGASR